MHRRRHHRHCEETQGQQGDDDEDDPFALVPKVASQLAALRAQWPVSLSDSSDGGIDDAVEEDGDEAAGWAAALMATLPAALRLEDDDFGACNRHFTLTPARTTTHTFLTSIMKYIE